ncbi:hypothetical protein PMNALOAF_3832 [Methylobacterium adhaesivum]|jgi:hypothetical protein|uniref:Uncharacterized protein n=1 Tax=Methylobacterium adhaesivum TaxID=333297 RepID=A0ABT8BJ62_9HYPH|nr:hypothetical protein [Methylobacterium adhaesivum]MDN3592189.1 hypothetical protein [Methylobacterium adhaesivum]GJD32556.1 hypothetical protein PMNALOAF_3832 [Methylobacterium adhaesivum]
MVLPHRNHWPEFDASPEKPGLAQRTAASVRAICTPTNLAALGVLAFGWFALVGWTGAGPDSWQARICADLDLQPRACAVIRSAGDAS